MRASRAASSTVASRASGAWAPSTTAISPSHSRVVGRERGAGAADVLLVHLRELARDACRTVRRGVGQVAQRRAKAIRPPRRATTGSGVARDERDRLAPRAPSRGRKPTKRNRPSPASPLATSAASTALGPGIATTGDPRGDRGFDEAPPPDRSRRECPRRSRAPPARRTRASRRRARRPPPSRARRGGPPACPRCRGARAAAASSACPPRGRGRSSAGSPPRGP